MGNKLESLSPEQISQGSQILSRFDNAWFPLAWGGRSLIDLGQERWLSGVFFLALTIGLSAIVFWLALKTAERLYYTGWASLQVSIQRKKNHQAIDHRNTRTISSSIFRHLLPRQVGAIISKDFKVITRDLNNLSQVVGVFIMGIVLAVMLLRSGGKPPAGNGEAPALVMIFIPLSHGLWEYGDRVVRWLGIDLSPGVGCIFDGRQELLDLEDCSCECGKAAGSQILYGVPACADPGLDLPARCRSLAAHSHFYHYFMDYPP